jgi:hypothetical protein
VVSGHVIRCAAQPMCRRMLDRKMSCAVKWHCGARRLCLRLASLLATRLGSFKSFRLCNKPFKKRSRKI